MKRGPLAACAVAAMAALVAAAPAAAASQVTTVKVTCTGGSITATYYVAPSALGGQTTANTVYNAVNPLGETCTAVQQ